MLLMLLYFNTLSHILYDCLKYFYEKETENSLNPSLVFFRTEEQGFHFFQIYFVRPWKGVKYLIYILANNSFE